MPQPRAHKSRPHRWFSVEARDSKTAARTGVIATPHGVIHTPAFIPVATRAALRGIGLAEARALGVEVLMVNTYHMLLTGFAAVKRLKGLHRFMGWEPPLMTDSGGFQVFSLGTAQDSAERLNKFTDANLVNEFAAQIRIGRKMKPARIDRTGVTFFSPVDGKPVRLDPKTSIRIQETMSADLIIAFDDHESPLWSHARVKESLERNDRWERESARVHARRDQLLYGVVHGGRFPDLRTASARFVNEHFRAIAVGGAYGSKALLYAVLDNVIPLTDEAKPRHLLGIGAVDDILEAVARGVDTFDCVAPTRLARHQAALTRRGTVNVSGAAYRNRGAPLETGCACPTCTRYPAAYVSHLVRQREIAGIGLLATHNVYFVMRLMADIRAAIAAGAFPSFRRKFLAAYRS